MDNWIVLVIAAVVGLFGSMLGIGGGVLIIPILTLFFDVPIKVAIGASAVSVIATSTAGGAVYARHGMTHIRLGLLLQISTAIGALAGGITAALLNPRVLQAIFAALLVYMVYTMRRLPTDEAGSRPTGVMDTRYMDPMTGRGVRYGVRRLRLGLLGSVLAGNLSGLLGIGGGVVNVPMMSLLMGVPLKAAIATSNFMIGVTAATTASIYYAQGLVNPQMTVLVALGILLGAQMGPSVGRRIRSHRLKQIFEVVLVVFAVQMLYQAAVG